MKTWSNKSQSGKDIVGRMKNTKYSRLLIGLLGIVLIGMLGACTVENISESDDGLQFLEAVSEQKEVPIEESAPEPVNTSETNETPAPMVEPKSTPETTVEPTMEPTNTPEVTSEPTVEPTRIPEVTPAPIVEPTPSLEVTQESTPQPTIKEDVEQETATTQTDYVLNKNTKKFHYSGCSSVKQMKDKNKKFYTGTREECISMGYDPCGRCKP